MPTIVQVNVTQQVAPSPNSLQQTGAFISQGGTTLAAGKYSQLTSKSSLAALLATGLTIASLAWSTDVVTVTTVAAHGLPNSETLELTIAGAAPVGYNGTFPCTVTGADTFTYPLSVNPGSETSPGTWLPASVGELTQMNNTFFAQGVNRSVFVLELGIGAPTDGITALGTFITNNPAFFYAYLVPRAWDGVSAYLSFLAEYEAPTSKTYFFTTTTSATYTDYTPLMKCVVALVEAPGIPNTEFSAASLFQRALLYNPSNTNKVTPFAFTYVSGVTPYPIPGNSTLLTALKAAGVNVIGTGAEGGISNTLILWGTTMDSNDFTYWYTVDWVQINIDTTLSNAVINGSNDPINPLYLDQPGINTLQAALASLMGDGVQFGMVLGAPIQTALDGNTLDTAINNGTYTNKTVINAVPFITYYTANPADYKTGTYAGYSIIFVAKRGFIQIIINVLVSQFVTA